MATSQQTIVPVSTSPVPMLVGNAQRVGVVVNNRSSSAIYVGTGNTVSDTVLMDVIAPQGRWEAPAAYTGDLWAIWAAPDASPSSAAFVTEYLDPAGPAVASADGAALSAVTVATGSPAARLLAANVLRAGGSVYNRSSTDLFVGSGPTTSPTNFIDVVPPLERWDIPDGYAGELFGVWLAADSSPGAGAKVAEFASSDVPPSTPQSTTFLRPNLVDVWRKIPGLTVGPTGNRTPTATQLYSQIAALVDHATRGSDQMMYTDATGAQIAQTDVCWIDGLMPQQYAGKNPGDRVTVNGIDYIVDVGSNGRGAFVDVQPFDVLVRGSDRYLVMQATRYTDVMPVLALHLNFGKAWQA